MDKLIEKLETSVEKRCGGHCSGRRHCRGCGSGGVRAQRGGRLLLEKGSLLGGLATNGLISWYEPLCDGHGEQLMTGLAEELLRLSIRYGDDTLPGSGRTRPARWIAA